MSNQAHKHKSSTTFNTWSRIASDQMNRVAKHYEQNSTIQAAALEQSRDLFNYNIKLAMQWQRWVSNASQTLTNKIFKKKS